jgi:hypothetical protein
MKGATCIALAFALMLPIVPAIAEDTSRGFSTLPAATRASLAPLRDDQLATLASTKRAAGTPHQETSRKTAITPRAIPVIAQNMLHDSSPMAAADDMFHAFSTMPAAQQFSLAPLPDEQLAAVQGKEMLPDVLWQIFNSLLIIPHPATTVSSGMGPVNSMSTQSFSYMEENIGTGSSQTNTIHRIQKQ